MSVDRLPQSRHLQLLTMNLPGDQIPYGTLCVRGPNSDLRSALSAAELSRWTEMLGAGPGQIMEKAAAAMSAGDWGRERALAYLRLVFSSYPEIACNRGNMRQYHSHRAVTETLALLQTRYFDSSLTVPLIAARIGVSASHLAALFRQTTGQTIHQMLIDIRMRRATELLSRTQYSIKKIAELTGWHNQLYFSAAYRRRHGKPPSAARSA
jgi:AraC-like DNA-binding protein